MNNKFGFNFHGCTMDSMLMKEWRYMLVFKDPNRRDIMATMRLNGGYSVAIRGKARHSLGGGWTVYVADNHKIVYSYDIDELEAATVYAAITDRSEYSRYIDNVSEDILERVVDSVYCIADCYGIETVSEDDIYDFLISAIRHYLATPYTYGAVGEVIDKIIDKVYY